MASECQRIPRRRHESEKFLQMDSITQECSPDRIQAVLQALEKQEEKRRKKDAQASEPSNNEALNRESRGFIML